jgi:hypothetical protein
MAGQMGQVKITTQNLKIVGADAERNVLLIKGSVPGSKGAVVFVRSAVKSTNEEGVQMNITMKKSQQVKTAQLLNCQMSSLT